jgi:predicted ATPase
LWFLGYPDQALQRVHEAFALAQTLSHPMSFGFALNFASTVHQFRKEEQLAQEWAEAITKLASEPGVPPHLFRYTGRHSTFMAFASEHGFTQFVARGTFLRETLSAGQSQVAQELTQLHQNINTYLVAGGAELLRPIFLSGLAAAHGTVGQIDEGLVLVTDALAVLNKGGQRLNEAGLYLFKGSLLLKSEDPKVVEAEECFRQALDVARRQEAKSLELQAATSLARLWQQQGKRAEAHKLLSDVYNWFTEGFDTKDLQEAKALLETL